MNVSRTSATRDCLQIDMVVRQFRALSIHHLPTISLTNSKQTSRYMSLFQKLLRESRCTTAVFQWSTTRNVAINATTNFLSKFCAFQYTTQRLYLCEQKTVVLFVIQVTQAQYAHCMSTPGSATYGPPSLYKL